MATENETNNGVKRLSRFAAVWLVMKGDAYVPGALVSAASWRATGSVADTVCMVTPDVSERARSQLRAVFDVVREVPVLEQRCITLNTPKKKKMYGSWVQQGFTKWRCLSLTEYDRVLLLDADTVVTSCMDELFTLQAPAGTFSSAWCSPYDTRFRKPNPYAHCEHGQIVPWSALERGRETFVLIGTTVLLRPSETDHAALETWLRGHRVFGYPRCGSMLDEQCIAMFYHTQRPHTRWTHIHQRFNAIPWKLNWLPGIKDGAKQPTILHYFNRKPWDLARAPESGCDSWADVEAFWQQADALVNAVPHLADAFNPRDLHHEAAASRPCFWCSSLGRPSTECQHQVFDAHGRTACPLLAGKQKPRRKTRFRRITKT